MTARFEERVSAGMAMFVIAMVPYAFTLLLIRPVEGPNRDIIMALVGAMVVNATQAVQHRFSSTPTAARKDETINVLAHRAADKKESEP